MATLLLMPEVATGDTEAILSTWAVPVGADFRTADTIVVVETAKAVVDVEAETDGVILTTLVAEGSDVKVGDAIAVIGAPGETVADLGAVLAELGVADGVVGTPPPIADAPATPVPPVPPVDVQVERIFASPLARRLAKEARLELAGITGSGPNGRIRRVDVEAALAGRAGGTNGAVAPAAAAPAAPPAPAPVPVPVPVPVQAPVAAPGTGYTEVPHTRLRKAIARRLTESVTTAPHFQLSGVADVDRLLALRKEINGSTAAKVSVNDLIVKAVAHAHTAVPAMNVTWTADALRQYAAVDVALAVATPTGLVTPVLRGVDTLGVGAIAAVSRDLAERARAGRLQQHELEGGTVTVSNLGMYGTREFTAIINPPHASILAVGAATPEPVARDGSMAVASLLRLTVSVDHRPVDGATAAEWMRALVAVLENPLGLLV